jgi:hypothetical protein
MLNSTLQRERRSRGLFPAIRRAGRTTRCDSVIQTSPFNPPVVVAKYRRPTPTGGPMRACVGRRRQGFQPQPSYARRPVRWLTTRVYGQAERRFAYPLTSLPMVRPDRGARPTATQRSLYVPLHPASRRVSCRLVRLAPYAPSLGT